MQVISTAVTAVHFALYISYIHASCKEIDGSKLTCILTCHAGFHYAGAFTKSKKQLQTGAAADQMLAIDKQMQELLGRMQRHNQLIAAQHLDIEKRHEVRLIHKQTTSANAVGSMTDSAGWPAKINFPLFDKVRHQNLGAAGLVTWSPSLTTTLSSAT